MTLHANISNGVIIEVINGNGGNHNYKPIDKFYEIGTPVKLVGDVYTHDPKPDDGEVYARRNEQWEKITDKDPEWQEHVQSQPTTKELFTRMSDVLGLSEDDLTGVINGLIQQYTPTVPKPKREDIFTSANKPSTPGDYFTMKPLTDFEYLGFLWRSDVKGNREEELLIPTRVFLALPTVPIGHWVLNPVSSVTKNRGVNSYCVCPIAGETHKVRISRVNDYFLESIWGYK